MMVDPVLPREEPMSTARAKPLSPVHWVMWISLCLLAILNGNSVAVLAGAPERFLNPILLLVALIVLGMGLEELPKIGRPPVPAFLIFAAAFLLSGAFAATLGNYIPLDKALEEVPLYGAAVLLVLCGLVTATRAAETDRTDALLKTLFWPFVAASFSGLVFVLVPWFGNVLALQPGARLHGVFTNIIELGGQSGFSLVLGLVLTMRTKRAYWVVIGTVAGLTAAIGSFSKASMLGFLPLLALLGYVAAGARLRLKPLLVLVAVVLLGAAVAFGVAGLLLDGALGIELGTDQRLRLESLMDIIASGTLDETTTTGRTAVWKIGFEHWKASPIFGLGLSAFDRVRGPDIEIHNSALRVLGESGLVGMIAFVVMLTSLVIVVVRHPRRDMHVLGLGFLLVQLPAFTSMGYVLLSRNHNLITGAVLGLLIATSPRGMSTPAAMGARP
jgi:O-antigen ligase